MTFNSLLLEPTQLYLELSAATQTYAWQQSQPYALPASRWNAYLNQVCLTAFLSWLQEEQDSRARSGPIPSATQFLGSCQWDGDRSQRRATSADSE